MTPANAWLAGFAAVVVACVATVLLRAQPSIVRGRSLFSFTLAYFALASAVLLWREGFVPAAVTIAGGVALVVTALATPWWFILGGPRSAVVGVIELCFGRVCARYERQGDRFMMTVPGGALHVSLHGTPLDRVTLLSFRARPPHRKGGLFQQLLLKQYGSVLPTIRIRMR